MKKIIFQYSAYLEILAAVINMLFDAPWQHTFTWLGSAAVFALLSIGAKE